MKKVYLTLFTLSSFLVSCFSGYRKQEVMMTDSDFVQFNRLYSPNKSMLLIDYGIDEGAFGSGYRGTAILKLIDTTKNLDPFTLANSFTNLKWLNNDTITAQYDILSDVRNATTPVLQNIDINGVKVIDKRKMTALKKMTPLRLCIRNYHRMESIY